MKARKLTAKFLERLQPPRARRVTYPDAHLRGLCLRVQSSGAKSWVVVRRVKGSGRQRLITIGSYPAFDLAGARDAARDIVRDLERGIDPVEKRKAAEREAAENFETVWEAFRVAVIEKRRTGREMAR